MHPNRSPRGRPRPARRKLRLPLVLATAALGHRLAVASTIRDDVPDASYTAYSASPSFAAAGYVLINNGQVFGSGTLIAPDWVLTAAHMVTQNSAGFPAYAPSSVAFGQGAASAKSGNDLATEVVIEPGWTYSPGDGNDLALFKLATPITDVAPAQLYPASLGAELGQTAAIVGYGRTGTGLTGDTGSSGIRRAFTNVIDAFGGDPSLPAAVLNTSSNLMYTDFDQPGNSSASILGVSTPTPLEGSATPGDSGGGLYLTQNGQTYLAGVTDFLGVIPGNPLGFNPDGHYGDYNAFTRLAVSQSQSFIDATLSTPSTWLASSGGSWLTPQNWTGSNIPEFQSATANFGPTTAAATITLDANWTVGAATFNNANSYTLAPGNGGTLVLDNRGLSSTATISITTGSHTISAPIAGPSGLQITGPGTLCLSGANSYSGPTTVASGSLIILSPASLPESSPLTIGSATAIATVQLATGIGTVSQSALTISPGSVLDIADNTVAINYAGSSSPESAIAAAIAAGAITSTSILNPAKYAIGYADGSLDPYSVAQPNQVLIRYTLLGDANLDGTVDISDLAVIAQRFGTTGNDWANGNFTGDPSGSVGFQDLVYVCQNFGDLLPSPQLSAPPDLFPASAMPEPISFYAAVTFAVLLRPRCRNRSPRRK